MESGPIQIAPWPFFSADEIDAVSTVLRSGRVNWWTGEECRVFEQEWSRAFGVGHALAMANGSVSLEVALKALGIAPGDEVVVPPRSYVASASAVVLVGATPVFADIDADSQNITARSVEAVLTKRTRAILPVHLSGWPCDMPALMTLAKQHDLMVLEDCAQAHGATIDGRAIGSFGDFASWSFCQDKLITTGGEGGMLATPSEALFRVAWSLSQHGKDWDASFTQTHAPGFRWLIDRFGSNHRMTEMQAVIGRLQLSKLKAWIEQRRRNAAILRETLDQHSFLRTPWPSAREGHVFYRLTTFVRDEALPDGWSRDRLMGALNDAGVPCFVGACPEIYRERAFVEADLAPKSPLPVAAAVGATSLTFLVHPTIDDEAMRLIAARVAQTLNAVGRSATSAPRVQATPARRR